MTLPQIIMKTKQEILDQIEKLQGQLKQLESKFDPNKFIDGIFNNFVRKVDRVKYPDVAFFGFDLEGNYLFEYDEKNGRFWVSYSRIWVVLEKEMKWNNAEIQKFIETKVEEHFKIGGVTPTDVCSVGHFAVEEHFKIGGVTPHALDIMGWILVEEHFKIGGVILDTQYK